jgi:F-type H+-transporting ATPase subunit b
MVLLRAAASGLESTVAEGVEVDFDLSFVVQVGFFLLLLVVLKPLLFDPMLKLFEEREKRTLGAKAQARKIDEKSASALSEYEAQMANARGEANAERDRLRAEGMKAEAELLGEVRRATAATLDEGKKKALAEATRAREALQAQTSDLARDVATRVLGREVQP